MSKDQEFYRLLLAILYRLHKVDIRFNSLPLLKTKVCNEYLRSHPDQSVQEVLGYYYESIHKLKESQMIHCQKEIYELNMTKIEESHLLCDENLSLTYVQKMFGKF